MMSFCYCFRSARVCTEDCDLGNMPVKKGVSVLFSSFTIHYNPELWSEPEKFDPERYTCVCTCVLHLACYPHCKKDNLRMKKCWNQDAKFCNTRNCLLIVVAHRSLLTEIIPTGHWVQGGMTMNDSHSSAVLLLQREAVKWLKCLAMPDYVLQIDQCHSMLYPPPEWPALLAGPSMEPSMHAAVDLNNEVVFLRLIKVYFTILL